MAVLVAAAAVVAAVGVAVALAANGNDDADPVRATDQTAAASGPALPLFDTHWWLVGVSQGGEDVAVPQASYLGLRFVEQGACATTDPTCTGGPQLVGSDSCNQFSAAVMIEGDTVRLDSKESTMMGCVGGSGELVQRLFGGRELTYAIRGDELRLTSATGDIVVTYRPLDGPFGPTEGWVVDEGESEAGAYRLVWGGGLTVEVVGAESPGHPGTTSVGPDPGRVNAMRADVNGRPYLFGIVPAETNLIMYEPAGGEPEAIDIIDVGDDTLLLMGQFVDAAPATWDVVAYDASGRELHRLHWG